MITFSQLGKMGRLGNQLYQIAATVNLALTHGTTFMFPQWKYASKFKGPFPQVHPDRLPTFYRYHHKPFEFQPIPMVKDKNMDLVGWFQSEKYFEQHKKYILGIFQFSDSVMLQAHHNIERDTYKGQEGKNVAIHVRRGDYVQLQNYHPTMPISWYQQAVETMQNLLGYKINILVFSDDVQYIAEHFTTENFPTVNRITIQKPEPRLEQYGVFPEIADLATMALCNHHIICNSTFSAWAAILAQNYNTGSNKVIAPKTWFGPACNHNPKDIYNPNWIKL